MLGVQHAGPWDEPISKGVLLYWKVCGCEGVIMVDVPRRLAVANSDATVSDGA